MKLQHLLHTGSKPLSFNMAQHSLSRRFSGWSTGLKLNCVPDDVRVVARKAMLDTLGVMAAGGEHPLVQALAGGQHGAEGPCSVLCRGTGDAEIAALVNGAAAHAWDFDDTSYTGIMHGSAIVFPVALALVEESKANEDDLLLAFIVGSEISYTLADICTHDHYFSGWWSSLTFGLVGATATAGYLLGLTEDQATHAISLAAASAGGGKVVFGSDGKPFLVGEAARRAIGFARAAKIGLTGPLQAFEDSRGFFALLNKSTSKMSEADTLGQCWRLISPGLLFKTSPVCSAAHAAIEQMAKLMDQSGTVAEDIASIKVEVPELVDISLVYPRPATMQQAQFSLPYALACAAIHGCVRLTDLSPEELISKPKVKLMEKVTATVAEDLSTEKMRLLFPESARLTVTLFDGRVLSGFCAEAYGMPGRPLSSNDLVTKFIDCLAFAGIAAPKFSIQEENLLKLASKILRPVA